MGYRSDLALALNKEASLKLRDAICLEENDAVEALFLLADKKLTSTDGARLYFWEGIKMYPSFAEFAWLGHFLRSLNGDSYFLTRIGEDYTDVETEGSYIDNHFELRIDRNLSFVEA